MKRAPAPKTDLHAKDKTATAGVDLGSSYGDEVENDPSSAEKARRMADGEDEDEYGSSDEDIDDEAQLEEGELNEA